MKDYTLDGKRKNKYIVSCKEEDNGTYTVTFADGTKFTNLAVNEENFNKINNLLERQSEKALRNFDKFVLRKTKAKYGACATSAASIVAGIGFSSIPAASSVSPVILATVFGTVAICSSIPNLVKLSKEKSRIKELQKISYRNKNWDIINSYDEYSNSLQGVKKSVAKKIEESEEPFAMINIDNFDIETLMKIVENIEREDEYGFSYSEGSVEDVDNTDTSSRKL